MIKQVILSTLLTLHTISLTAANTPLKQLFNAIEANKHKQVDIVLKKNLDINERRSERYNN